jgi:DNA-binding NtrC family response regulator
MSDPGADGKLPRSITRKLEQHDEFPLSALEARRRLDEVECDAIESARERGATLEDIAEALGVSRQAVHYKLQHIEARRARGAA